MNNELLGELLQGLTDDLASIKKGLAAVPPPVDYRPSMEKMAAVILTLQKAVAAPVNPAPGAGDPGKDLERQLRQAVAEEVRRYHPDRPLTQAVRYGVWVFVGVVALLCLSLWGWRNAAHVRDQHARSAWLWRATRQAAPAFAMSVAARWRQDSVSFQEQTMRLEERERLLLLAQRKRAEAVLLEKQATPQQSK